MKIRCLQRDGIAPGQRARYVIRWVSAILIGCWLVSHGAPDALSQSENTAEYSVKLAVLYNFTQFVEWPAETFRDANAPLMVCVVGEDPFGADLERELRTRTAGSHRLEMTRVKQGSDLRACHIVFVTAAQKKRTPTILASLGGADTLTVGETKEFTEHGGIISFTIEKNKLRFEINLDAARRTRLKISSKLLALSRIVQSPSPPSASGWSASAHQVM